MKNKIAVYPNGYATMERTEYTGLYVVCVYRGQQLHDKRKLDDYRQALEFWRSFKAIAKAA